MVERIEDLNLPNAVISRLIKDALPDGANVSKEGRAAITRSASVFAIFLTSSATALAHQQNHKTITARDILETLTQLDFESFVPSLQQDLEVYRQMVKNKKESKASKKEANADISSGPAVAEVPSE
ncbi:DNA polymerase epsilon subunit 3 [Scaptodrosophila lebanonensis]|uniref:DNA polymerase epsilon subunit 3 n=1 Tax=Drosophila lebanonensis TaxID=7225 RepID=A0A6J2TZF6_DROLE|nr:DNA polymerase epsilon subunit 3 [Scaptodrosophila lebanonensis]